MRKYKTVKHTHTYLCLFSRSWNIYHCTVCPSTSAKTKIQKEQTWCRWVSHQCRNGEGSAPRNSNSGKWYKELQEQSWRPKLGCNRLQKENQALSPVRDELENGRSDKCLHFFQGLTDKQCYTAGEELNSRAEPNWSKHCYSATSHVGKTDTDNGLSSTAELKILYSKNELEENLCSQEIISSGFCCVLSHLIYTLHSSCIAV